MANGAYNLSRKPRRLSITVPETVLDYLTKRADYEGRSVSNLAAYLIERSINEPPVPSSALLP